MCKMKFVSIVAFGAAGFVAIVPAATAESARDWSGQAPVVTVVGGPAPKVVATFPANGASVPAGVLVLKVTFDQPMAPDSWSFGPLGDGAFPRCLAQPRLLADQRTFALLCTVAQQRQTYAIEVNAAPVFANASGRRARATPLHFSTTAAVTRDMHAALAQAGLTDVDEPLMSWRDEGAGVSRSPPAPDDDN
jgi:hypothetical protein